MEPDQQIRHELRTAQQTQNVARLKELLDSHPELVFTEDPLLLSALSGIYVLLNRREDALRCLDELEPELLTDAAALSDYGIALYLLDRKDEAVAALKEACKRKDSGFEAFARLGAIHVTNDKLADAQSCFERALDLDPDHPAILSNLGGVEFRQGQFKEALELYDRALALRPELVQAHEMRSKVLIALDRADELIEKAQALVDQDPNDPLRHFHLANVMMQVERWPEAEAILNAAIDRFPDKDEFKQALVRLLFEMSAHWKAGVRLKAWAEERDEPDWTSLALNRARIESKLLDSAEESLESLSQTELAQEPGFEVLRAKLHIERAQADEAVEILFDAIDRFPGNMEIRSLLAHTLTSLGRLEEARNFSDEVSTNQPMALIRHLEGKGNRADDHEIERLAQLFESPSLADDARSRIGFTFATCLEKRGEYDRAFPVLEKANELTRRRLKYRWQQHRKMTDNQIRYFTKEVVERLSGQGHSSHRPIFVTGMPRSGTTLTEQILCSHPKVYGAGELHWIPKITKLMQKVVADKKAYPEAMHSLTASELKNAADYYLQKIALQDPETPRVVDKLPHNFDYIGLMALMFPNAVIIHLDRDPRDVAVSNFYQNFTASHGLMGFAYDLSDIGHMLNEHDRIMAHWHELLPGRIFELNYQELVKDTENVVSGLLDHCGLEWDDQVLRFYETKRPVRTASIRQVRKGIYTSSAEKWRRYEHFLKPLNEVLAKGYLPLDEADAEKNYQNVIAGPTGLVTS